MVIPHNEKSIKNIRLSNLSLSLLLFFASLTLVLSSFFLIKHSIHSKELERLNKFYSINQKKMEIFNKYLDKLNHQTAKLPENMEYLSDFHTKKSFGVGGKEIDYEELDSDLKKSFDKNSTPYSTSPLNIASNNAKYINNSYLASKKMVRFFQKRIDFMQLIPSLWPIHNKKGAVIGDDDNKMKIALIGGEEVIATGLGKVEKIDLTLNGLTVKIHHGYGIFSEYSGLEQVQVKEDDRVSRSTVIGIASSLLTYRVKISSKYLDPKLFAIIR